MSSDSTIKLVLFLITMIVLLGSIIYQARNKTPAQRLEERFSDALTVWLKQQVCLRCNTTLDSLDPRTLKRINGAAQKAVKPLRASHQVQIKLPKIIKNRKNEWIHFSLNVSIKDVHHLMK